MTSIRVHIVDQHVIYTVFHFSFVDADAAGRIALRIGVDQQHLFTQAMPKQAPKLMAVVVFPTPPF